MSKRLPEIKDDELRVIGRQAQEKRPVSKTRTCIIIIVAILAAVVIGILTFRGNAPEEAPTVFEPVSVPSEERNLPLIGNYADTVNAYTELLKYTINDIELNIYIPHNSKPVLQIGQPAKDDQSIILTTQAADIRADNGKINGAFVLGGKPMAWGLSKKGYVAIINDQIRIGVSENSPLFEEATEKSGYFFRQYALVDNGVLVENEPKGKSIRKAICERNGEILVVVSETPESFHDFSQTLVDFGVNNAVYLVGGDTFGYYRDSDGTATPINESDRTQLYKNENYITWKER